MANGLTPTAEALAEPTLSDISRRYRRNTLAVFFILSVLLLFPDINTEGLSIFGLQMDKDATNREAVIWTVISTLSIYQFAMFLSYARPDAKSWLSLQKKHHNILWFYMTDIIPFKYFRKPTDRFKIISAIKQGDLMKITFIRGNQKSEDNNHFDLHLAEAIIAKFRRMIFLELGLPIVWAAILIGYGLYKWLAPLPAPIGVS